MQIKIRIVLDCPLTLPVSYHHILQGVIYHLMSEDENGTLLHDNGSSFGKRAYKLFTYGPILGIYKVKGHRITFLDEITFEVRALDSNVIWQMEDNILEYGIRFGEHLYEEVECEVSDNHLTLEEARIQMISPICVYKTDEVSKHTTFFTPDEFEFFEAITANMHRKYKAATGTDASMTLQLMKLDVQPKDKYFTQYKNFYLEGYKGIYKIKGKPEELDFLYQVGIGAKNSQGFGMFEVL